MLFDRLRSDIDTTMSTASAPCRCPGIPLITGGNGWRIQALMQWATAYDMPVAVGVAKAWGDYVPGTRSGRGRGLNPIGFDVVNREGHQSISM